MDLNTDGINWPDGYFRTRMWTPTFKYNIFCCVPKCPMSESVANLNLIWKWVQLSLPIKLMHRVAGVGDFQSNFH